MAASVAHVNLHTLTSRAKSLVDADIVVGKDILELLANAMYIDPLTIYREYIQNSADSIDEARQIGLLADDEPSIAISLDHVERTVRIRDNGMSIPNTDFVRRITTIGASHKRGTDLRGFRGVGRLSGLGYCQELVFRGKAKADTKVIEVRWDSRVLREKIRDVGYAGSLIDLIREVVHYTELPAVDKSERFFEVELRKVGRLKNDLLMNEASIRSYLSQVAPVPFHPDFSFGPDIQSFLIGHGLRPPVRIELNDNAGPVYHRARDLIEFNPKSSDKVRGIEYVEIPGDDDDIAAFGWICDQAYMGAVPKRLGLGGIRMRAGNIQVGDELMLATLFTEPRFASWAIGDIHIASKKIIPNGRRDDFESNVHYARLQSNLSILTKNLAHQVRMKSQQRQRLRAVQVHFKAIEEWIRLAAQDETPPLLRKALLSLTADHVQKAEKEASKLPSNSDDHALAIVRLAELSAGVAQLGEHVENSVQTDNRLSAATERALLKALKVVLSNARSAKVGTKTALDIVEAVSGSR